MKKLERNIPGVYDFDEVLDYLHRGIMDMRTNVVWNLIQMQDTVTLAGQWDGRRDGVRCAFRVYEKYIYTHSRGYRLTLTMMLARSQSVRLNRSNTRTIKRAPSVS